MCFCFNYFDCGFYRKIPIFYNRGIIELKCFQCNVWWSVWKLVPTHQTVPSLFWEVVFNLDSAGIPPSIFYFLFWFFFGWVFDGNGILALLTSSESGCSDKQHLCFSHSHETRQSFTRISSPHFIAFFFCIVLTEQYISSVSSRDEKLTYDYVLPVCRHCSNDVWLWWTSDSQTVHTVRNKPRACVSLMFGLSNLRTQTVLILLDNQTNFSCNE